MRRKDAQKERFDPDNLSESGLKSEEIYNSLPNLTSLCWQTVPLREIGTEHSISSAYALDSNALCFYLVGNNRGIPAPRSPS